MTMETRDYTVRFLTPAFLGDAQQNGRWRTPPFKHLLREWWRVAYAEARNFDVDVDAMRREEARLFGAAGDGQGNHRSLVRMQLKHWQTGRQNQWQVSERVRHPEVGNSGAQVGADLYLGYGPLAYDKKSKSTVLKTNAAIEANEENQLSFAYPESDSALLTQALALIHAFGTLGGRSRNGWGSIQLEEVGETQPPLRDWKECLCEEWAHAIGRDEQGGALIWRTRQTFDDWKALMEALARIKIELRTSFPFSGGGPHPSAQDRHWLSYPVTNHSVRPWGNQRRLPNSLRFKVRRDGNGRLYGVIFHMPCRPPKEFRPDTSTLSQVWQRVHQFLDGQPMLQRSLV